MKLKWLSHKPKMPVGVNWGTPWVKGELLRDEMLMLDDKSIQSWPMAFWPDGSVKWTGHAAVFGSGSASTYELQRGVPVSTEPKINLEEHAEWIQIDTGAMQCRINQHDHYFIDSLIIDGKKIGEKAHLILLTEKRTVKANETVLKQSTVKSDIEHVTVERKGSVQSVIKIEGKYAGQFPFTLRLYFFAGISQIKVVHTFFYDGDAKCDYISGLGMKFSVNAKGELWNRQVRVATETGIYNESAKLLLSRRHRKSGAFRKQVFGGVVTHDEIETLEPGSNKQVQSWNNDVSVLGNAEGNAVWNDYKFIQQTANSYKFTKRTASTCSWIDGFFGERGKGMIYAGGENGGLALGLKDFWQKYPATLEVSGLGVDDTSMMLWLWSPDGEAMDMRHYSEHTHTKSAYEGFDEMRATPVGIANTSEVFIKIYAEVPTNQELESFAAVCMEPPLLICEPEHYYQTKTLGVWSLIDRTHPIKHYLEDQLDACIDFYQQEIKQRSWYGYWHYGDFMHTYDPVRNQWCYDMGGYAWQNTELVPNIWLWYSFLRTGRQDIFKMAEAMTRHTSEVDRYHFGVYAGLGSRHNVSHWGCGCKEARISMAGLHKYYYFLTADDRMREILESVKDADLALDMLDPMRAFYAADQFKTHARVGPDWSAFCSNWLSEWERTENLVYLDKILVGLQNLKEAPYGLLSGPTYGYDTKTANLLYMGTGNAGGHHMIIAFGAPQVWMELADILDDEVFKDMIAEFGRVYLLTDEEKKAYSENQLNNGHFHWPMFVAAMSGYAAARYQDKDLAQKTWDLLLKDKVSGMTLPFTSIEVNGWKTLQEVEWISTNVVSQWCLNVIVVLELIGHYLNEIEV
jgi:hypothetical protein